MSNRYLKVGLVFTFDLNNEHEEMFEEMTDEQIVDYAKGLVTEDIDRFVKYGETYESLSAEFVTEGEASDTLLTLSPLQVDTLRGYLGEILATDSNEVVEEIYEQLVEEA
mgnify:CR=1 FL=1